MSVRESLSCPALSDCLTFGHYRCGLVFRCTSIVLAGVWSTLLVLRMYPVLAALHDPLSFLFQAQHILGDMYPVIRGHVQCYSRQYPVSWWPYI